MKNKKGITLIALIITIIVMLILVGVTINIVLNGGLFDTTKDASAQKEKTLLYDQVVSAMNVTDNGNINVKGTYEDAKEILTAQGKTVEIVEPSSETAITDSVIFKVTGKYGAYTYKITTTEIKIEEENNSPVQKEKTLVYDQIVSSTNEKEDGTIDVKETYKDAKEILIAQGKTVEIVEPSSETEITDNVIFKVTGQYGEYIYIITTTEIKESKGTTNLYGIYYDIAGGMFELQEGGKVLIESDGDTVNGTYTYDASAKTGSITVEDFGLELTFEQKDIIDENGELINVVLIIKDTDGDIYTMAGKNGALGTTPLTGKTYINEANPGDTMTFDVVSYNGLQIGIYYDHKEDVHKYCVVDGVLYLDNSIESIDSNYETITIDSDRNGIVRYILDVPDTDYYGLYLYSGSGFFIANQTYDIGKYGSEYEVGDVEQGNCSLMLGMINSDIAPTFSPLYFGYIEETYTATLENGTSQTYNNAIFLKTGGIDRLSGYLKYENNKYKLVYIVPDFSEEETNIGNDKKVIEYSTLQEMTTMQKSKLSLYNNVTEVYEYDTGEGYKFLIAKKAEDNNYVFGINILGQDFYWVNSNQYNYILKENFEAQLEDGTTVKYDKALFVGSSTQKELIGYSNDENEFVKVRTSGDGTYVNGYPTTFNSITETNTYTKR